MGAWGTCMAMTHLAADAEAHPDHKHYKSEPMPVLSHAGIRPGDWVATWPEAVLLGLHINPFEALGISSGRLYSVLLDVEDESGQEQGTAAAIKGGSNWEECEVRFHVQDHP